MGDGDQSDADTRDLSRRPGPAGSAPSGSAGVLRSSANAQSSITQTGGTGRADIRRAQVPQLPLAEQRGYGDAFRRADGLEAAARSVTDVGAELTRLLADGVAEGTLQPADEGRLPLR